MEYRIEKKGAFQVIGKTKRFTMASGVFNGGIGAFWGFWDALGLCEKIKKNYSSDKDCNIFDVSIATANTVATKPEDEFDYTIGFPYNGAAFDEELDIVTVPDGSYAIFTIPDGEDIGSFMGRCIDYLPTAGYELAGVEVEYFWENKPNEAWFLLK